MHAARLLITPALVVAVVIVLLTRNYRDASEARAARTPTPTQQPITSGVAPGPGRLFFAQVVGLSGCEQPLYIRAWGLQPQTAVRIERLDDPRIQLPATTDGAGAYGRPSQVAA